MAGRAALVRFVLSAIPVYLLIAMNVPKWFIKAANKLRGFCWKGRKEVNGGSCLVAWEKVQWPLDLGGLGIHNLEIMGWALQMKWLWLQKTAANKPWSGLQIPVHSHAKALFAISLVSHVGNGKNTLFWSDKWLHNCSLMDLAPEVTTCVPSRIIKNRTVEEALNQRARVRDIRGGLSLNGLIEYLQFWDLVLDFTLTELDDQHYWKHTVSGTFTPKSAYRLYFCGSITFEPWDATEMQSLSVVGHEE